MSRREQVVLTNMCMITDGRRVLVQDRKSEKWPGVTFPGAMLSTGRVLSPLSSARSKKKQA